ncbi:MAG: extracellular solute-binding protein, partial [Chloroflexota bacterium]
VSKPAAANRSLLKMVMNGDEEYDYADFSEPASTQWVVDDAVYGVPFSTSPFITIFNKDLFAAAGLETPDVLATNGEWTWEALQSSAQAIADQTDSWGFVGNDGGTTMYGSNPWGTLIPLLRAYGADIITDNECTMNSEAGNIAIQLIHDMVYADRSTVPPGDETVFWTGDVGITFGQISRLSNLDEAEFEWGIAELPSGPAGFNPVIGQAAIVAFDGVNNENQEIAADFVRFLTTETGVTRMTQFFPPARLSVLGSDEFLTTNPRVSAEDMENVVARQIAEGFVLTSHSNFVEIELTGGAALDLLW